MIWFGVGLVFQGSFMTLLKFSVMSEMRASFSGATCAGTLPRPAPAAPPRPGAAPWRPPAGA